MPKRHAIAELDYRYEEVVQSRINDFMGQAIKADYIKGSREINLDLTLEEAEYLFTASDKIKAMAASGELQKLHAKCDELEESVETSYITVMDKLKTAEIQINEAEDDIYEELRTLDHLEDIEEHGEEQKDTHCHISLTNFEQAKQHLGSDPIVARLQGLIRARVELLQTMIDIQHDYIHRIIGEDAAAVDELQTFSDNHKLLEGHAGPHDNLTGDAKLLVDTIEKLRQEEVN